MASSSDLRFEVQGVGSPITLLQGPATDDTIHFAASLTARYSDAKGDLVEVTYGTGQPKTKLSVKPADVAYTEKYRIF